MYRVVNDVIDFCWTAVVAMDPTYEQYCVDVGKTFNNYNPDDALVVDFPPAPRAGFSYATPYSEDENQVLKEMGAGDRNAELRQRIMEEQVEPSMEIEKSEEYLHNEKWSRKLELRTHYEVANRFAGNPWVLALPPPKTILSERSTMWNGSNTKYTIQNKGTDSREFMLATRYSVRVGKKDGHPRLCIDHYIGGRKRGFLRPDKKHQHRIVYNLKRRTLYNFEINGKKKHLFCANFNSSINITHEPILEQKFVQMVLDTVRKDVPDVHTFENPSVSFLALQHRYGKSMKWMTPELWDKTCDAIRMKSFVIKTDGNNVYTGHPETKKLINKGMRKFNKHFKKFSNYIGLLQGLFQSGYRKAFIELFTKVDIQPLVGIHRNLVNNKCPQTLYNFILEILRTRPDVEFPRNGGDETQFRGHNLTPAPQFEEVTNDLQNNTVLIDSWVKLCRRMIANSNVGIDWMTFRDTMRMAEQFNLRVRINKFKSPQDIWDLHTRLIEYQNRDNGVLRRYEYENSTIHPFTHPDKEYDGFRFEFLDTAQKLVDEGKSMHHCVGGYTYRCVAGTSLIFSMRKGDRSYITLELRGDSLDIVQKYTIGDNVVGNDKIKDLIYKWHKDLVNMHAEETQTYMQICDDFNNKEVEKKTQEITERLIIEDFPQVVAPARLADDLPF